MPTETKPTFVYSGTFTTSEAIAVCVRLLNGGHWFEATCEPSTLVTITVKSHPDTKKILHQFHPVNPIVWLKPISHYDPTADLGPAIRMGN